MHLGLPIVLQIDLISGVLLSIAPHSRIFIIFLIITVGDILILRVVIFCLAIEFFLPLRSVALVEIIRIIAERFNELAIFHVDSAFLSVHASDELALDISFNFSFFLFD